MRGKEEDNKPFENPVSENFPFWVGNKPITFDEAVFGHKHSWSWIGYETLKRKKIVKPEDYFSYFKYVTVPRNNKYCCEYAKDSCDKCPIKWNINSDYEVPCITQNRNNSTPYCDWLQAVEENNYERAAQAALAISNLPTRENQRTGEESPRTDNDLKA